MTTPHEWFGPEEYGPHLHNRHAAEPYFDDPDYWGHHHGPALPAISTLGRGPRGRGLYIANLKDSDGQLSFDIMEEGTNELVYSVPNIAGDIITNIKVEHDNVQPGDITPLDITVKRGGQERTYTVDLPSGAPGSTMFLAGEFTRTSDDTYHTTVGDITLYGKSIYRHRPWPRPNDSIACTIREQDGSYYLAIGTIENVGGNQNNRAEHNPLDTVVFTCRTFAKIPDVSISTDGTWIVGGTDTGVLAKGEKGEKGDRGEQGPRGLTGATGLKGDKGDTGDRGPKGDPGVNGRNGRDGEDGKGFELGEVTTSSAAYGQPASATFTLVTGTENTYDLDLVIPEGKPGEELKWQPGIWPYDQLPSWTDTPVNTIFVVRDTDQYLDLYIRGQLPVEAELGGPWVVVENILQYPIDYTDLEGSPIVWNEETQQWEEANGYHAINDYLELENIPVSKGDTSSLFNIDTKDSTFEEIYDTSVGRTIEIEMTDSQITALSHWLYENKDTITSELFARINIKGQEQVTQKAQGVMDVVADDVSETATGKIGFNIPENVVPEWSVPGGKILVVLDDVDPSIVRINFELSGQVTDTVVWRGNRIHLYYSEATFADVGITWTTLNLIPWGYFHSSENGNTYFASGAGGVYNPTNIGAEVTYHPAVCYDTNTAASYFGDWVMFSHRLVDTSPYINNNQMYIDNKPSEMGSTTCLCSDNMPSYSLNDLYINILYEWEFWRGNWNYLNNYTVASTKEAYYSNNEWHGDAKPPIPADIANIYFTIGDPRWYCINGYAPDWNDVVNKPDYATQQEVNAAIDAAIANRS